MPNQIKNGKKNDSFLRYKTIQIITQIFNESHSTMLIHEVATMALCQTVSAYTLIKTFGNSENVPLFALFGNIQCLVMSPFVIFGIYGYAGSVWSTSTSVLQKMRTNKLILRSKIQRRTAISLPILKIRFGGTNFIEKTTPLTFMDFNIGRTVDLLLIDKEMA
ncbi:unnamed protein product [Orchesella dallaii]|uniref:Uncharacterized protein n=1 Tax=Orchesella dallaii TaxID=48710 RepID=A0ABP1RJN3_9HEXA